jgi:predicted nucleic acid-binding protein
LLQERAKWDGYVSSGLLGVEAIRTCERYGDEYSAEALAFLEGVALLPLDQAVLDEAISIGPAELRTLDALHLATALSVKEEIGAFVTYDERLASAASHHGPPVFQP